jgi:hypothetical protein
MTTPKNIMSCALITEVVDEMCRRYPRYSRESMTTLVEQVVRKKIEKELGARTYYQYLGVCMVPTMQFGAMGMRLVGLYVKKFWL